MHGDEYHLVIEPNREYFWLAWGFVVFGLPWIIIGVTGWRQGDGPGPVPLTIGCGLSGVGAALLALRRRFVFDRGAGTLWMRPGLRARSLALSEVLAVQIIDGGTHSGSHGGAWQTQQLNLVLGGERRERVNVSNQPDRDWAVSTGVRLAEFLGVPLLGPSPGDRSKADRA